MSQIIKNDWIQENSIDGGFLQSDEWRKFKEKIGLKTFFVGDNENFHASILEHDLPFSLKYFFIPRGPIFNKNIEIKKYLNEVINLAKENNIPWVRIEPQSDNDLDEIKNNLDGFKIIKSSKNHQPPQTLIINLKDDKDEILSRMKKKTRYNIRLSNKKNINFFRTENKDDMEEFLDLMNTTANRNGIFNYSRNYYQQIFNFFDTDTIRLYVAKYEGKILAGIVTIFYGDIATNLYGASSNDFRNFKAPYGLRWKIIQDAKDSGCKKHDLGGTKIIKDKDGNNIPAPGGWFGFSQIKLGFCPKCEPVNFPGCYDVILDSKKYWFYRIGQKIKLILKKII